MHDNLRQRVLDFARDTTKHCELDFRTSGYQACRLSYTMAVSAAATLPGMSVSLAWDKQRMSYCSWVACITEDPGSPDQVICTGNGAAPVDAVKQALAMFDFDGEAEDKKAAAQDPCPQGGDHDMQDRPSKKGQWCVKCGHTEDANIKFANH